jgi:uncharacterized membrane protein
VIDGGQCLQEMYSHSAEQGMFICNTFAELESWKNVTKSFVTKISCSNSATQRTINKIVAKM